MSGVGLTLKNLGRNRLRTTLTVVAVALPMLVFTIARSFVDGVSEFFEQSNQNLRVCVHQKLTYTAWLPQRIREEILSLAPEGYIKAICRFSWFGGRIEGAQQTFPSAGVDRDALAVVYSEYEMTPEEIERFQMERRGAVVSASVAKRANWKVGDRVTLVGAIPPYPKVEFVVVAIPPKMRDWFYFGLDYYDEVVRQVTGTPIGVNNFWLKCNSEEARDWALAEIDKHFANSEHETRTEMESTFVEQFLRSEGDWVNLVWTVGCLIVLVAVAVAFNTMSMAFRERTSEFAVLRALGFSRGRIVAMVLSEGVLLGLIGGALAVLPIYAWTSLRHVELPVVPIPVEIPPQTAALALAVALAVGAGAAIVPAAMAGRLPVAPALRKVV